MEKTAADYMAEIAMFIAALAAIASAWNGYRQITLKQEQVAMDASLQSLQAQFLKQQLEASQQSREAAKRANVEVHVERDKFGPGRICVYNSGPADAKALRVRFLEGGDRTSIHDFARRDGEPLRVGTTRKARYIGARDLTMEWRLQVNWTDDTGDHEETFAVDP